MSCIIGKYIGMTSLFKNEKIIPCSIIQAGPCSILQIKTKKKDGYSSFQLGFGDIKDKKLNKPLKGFFKKNGIIPQKKIFEFPEKFINDNIITGNIITVEVFKEGEFVNITGLSKGKGFQGVIKRYKFAGVGQTTHGQHNRLRAPGSIGAGSDPSRVFKGTRMAGRMGNTKITIKNLEILKINIDKKLLIIKGSVPGSLNSYLIIKKNKIGGNKNI